MNFLTRLTGALYGVAVGDAMGAPVEGLSHTLAPGRYGGHDFNTFIPPRYGNDPTAGKGHGRITDDTLMTEALMRAYADAGDHLDAYGYKDFLLPHVKNTPVWVTEWKKQMPIYDRLWHPEKYPWFRLVPANAEPRTAGMGNMVNCGVAMWMMPVGAVNAGWPEAAYQEAVLIGSAHNESFAVEAAAVMAACYADAFATDATVDSILRVAEQLARDGTGNAIRAACGAVNVSDDLATFVARVRAAVAPFDQREGHTSDDEPLAVEKSGGSDIGRPSRVASIEELPVALAALRYGAGDGIKTLRAAVCYGRDCDSMAAMALGLLGALKGVEVIPSTLRAELDRENRRDFAAMAAQFDDAVRAIWKRDRLRFERRSRAMD